MDVSRVVWTIVVEFIRGMLVLPVDIYIYIVANWTIPHGADQVKAQRSDC